jgi:membrane complex biogenesis BtpA family protein
MVSGGIVMELFGVEKPIVGMIHLTPLPGTPKYEGLSLDRISELAVQDANRLESGGVDGLMVENFGDVPYTKKDVGPEIISAMAVIVADVVNAVRIPVGVNVLRNDFKAALAIAHVAGGKFIRTNVFIDATVTDQGLIEASAPELLRYRHYLGSEVKIFADVQGKHGVPLGSRPIEQSAMDAAYRGLADVLIVSGPRTGTEPRLEDLVRVKKSVPDRPVFVGSGVNGENAPKLLMHADGAIVGTSIKFDGVVNNSIDEKRVKALMTAVKAIRG